jgi:quercetin dioxygenase-like cupin family protein
MDIRRAAATTKGDADRFTGDTWYDVLAQGEAPSRIRVSVVRFAPGARTAWHAHALGQTLHVVEGVGRVQARGGALLEMRAGDTVHTPPGEWHWHGAAPDRFMAHLAMWEGSEEGRESEWGAHISDAEYAAPPSRRQGDEPA